MLYYDILTYLFFFAIGFILGHIYPAIVDDFTSRKQARRADTFAPFSARGRDND